MSNARNEIVYNEENIRDKIYRLRDVQVMIDRDLAALYQVKAIRLREQVKRNKRRFPPDFMFRLTSEEVDYLVSQNAIPSKKHLGGYLPYAFTEQGVASLSSVLNSEQAIEVNIKIMRAFVEMRKFILNNAFLFSRIENVERRQLKHEMEIDKKFEKIFNSLEKKNHEVKQGIFYDGQIFDAYQFVSLIIRKANETIVLIDNYIDETVLEMLTKKKKDVKVTILTKAKNKTLMLDEKKFNAQYPQIAIKEFDKSHDRFLIIDDNEVYHFGASLKDMGKKWFAFSKLDKSTLELLENIKKVIDI